MTLERSDYAIEPQKNIGTTENTQHVPCTDAEAEIFALYRLNGELGGADWVADFGTRAEAEDAEAEDYVRDQVAEEARSNAIFAALRNI